MRIDTDDSNAGEDCGGYFRFITKTDGGGNGERLRIKSDGTVYTVTQGAKFGISQDPTLDTMGATSGTWQVPEVDGSVIGAEMRIGDHNTNSTAIIRLASYGSGDGGVGGGAIMFTNTRCGSNSHHSDLAAIKGARESLGKGYLRFFTASQAASTEKMRITSAGLVGINTQTGGVSTNAILSIHSPSSSACRLNLTNTGSHSAESTQIWSQNNDLVFEAGADERLRILESGQATFDRGAPASANKTIARFQCESSRKLDIVWHDTGSLMGFDTPGNHAYIFKVNGTERLNIRSDAATGGIYVAPGTDGYGKIELQDNAIGGLRVSVDSETMSGDLKCPRKGVIMAITSFTSYDTYPQPGGTGFVYMDVGASKNIIIMQVTGTGANLLASGNAAYDADVADFTDLKITIQPGSTAQGSFRIVNRTNNDYVFTCTFL